MSGFQLINGKYVIEKDPQSKLDYGVRMYRWLVPGDLIDASFTPMWTVSAGLTILAEGVIGGGGIAMVKLAEGVVDGEMEWAECLWHTIQGRVEVQTLWFLMVEK